ncbi:sensor histidine kinase [Paenibacillus jiagnxiensis]|uniref:sensor histidine kinase n=1 Tax=Paenibacillus jiagnxiensis TaxID=3228926 RepID=UPI0033BD81CC
MFTKLRNRFLIVNLVTITVIMLVAFAAIYTITYRDVQSDINMELRKISDSYQTKFGESPPPHGGTTGPQSPANGKKMDDNGPPPERSISFMVQTDQDWNRTSAKSHFGTDNMDSDFYDQALEQVISKDSTRGKFTLDGSDWTFSVQPDDQGYMIVFMDTSAQQEILANLIYTFTAVGLGMLIVLYFTSRFFANRSIEPIKEAFAKQKQFIADASHELKTPLTIINTNTDVLLSNGTDTIQNQTKWLQYIKSETERMTKLTNDLLYLTEMDDSRTGLLFSRFDMSEAVETIILTMEAVIFEKQIKLDYDIEPGLTVLGSSEQIKQVVMILLDNAVKYTPPSGKVTVALKKQHNDVVLAVSNTGEGIAPEHLHRIFDRFYRTDTSRARKQGGYGLGLAIAKSIIDQHKGKIYTKSVAGESTTFYVQLS